MKKISKKELEVLTFDQRYDLLSPREQDYFDRMDAKCGVLYITSKPGLAKSSIAKNIAYIMGYNYLDIRLSTSDETDFGLPKLMELTVNGVVYHAHTMTVPEWAILANQEKTIIHFEELNRCNLQVRNACLGVLLERIIGNGFRFNDEVLMIASGNLGEDDGTDVEEFDAALNNRLIHVKHDLLMTEWVENWAKYNVHPLIISFLHNKPDFYYRKEGADNGVEPKAYATPRSWHMLSEYILQKSRDKENQLKGDYTKFSLDQIKNIVHKHGADYIGLSNAKFSTYLDETMSLSLKDILDGFSKVKDRFASGQVNRDKKSDLVNQLKDFDYDKMNPKQIKNLCDFLSYVDEDEKSGFLTWLVDKKTSHNTDSPIIKQILQSFKSTLDKIYNIT